jgi:hypothetical protein
MLLIGIDAKIAGDFERLFDDDFGRELGVAQ